jgi:hypothetical protein
MASEPSREEVYLQASEFLVDTSGIGDFTQQVFGVDANKMIAFSALMGLVIEETRDSDCQCKTCVAIRSATDGLDPNHV